MPKKQRKGSTSKERKGSTSKERNAKLIQETELRKQELLQILQNKNQLDINLNQLNADYMSNQIQPSQRISYSKIVSRTLGSIIKKDEQINLNYDQKIIHVVINLQSRFKMRKARKAYIILCKNYKYRKAIFRELVQSEETYQQSLQTLIDLVIQPCSKFLEQYEIKNCFSNIYAIKELATHMLASLKVSEAEWQPNQKSCLKILEIAPFFRIYFDYWNFYLTQLKNVENYKQNNKQFLEVVVNAEKQQKFSRQQLSSFLIKPIQRLPKYVLLLKEYQKFTDPSHEDYENIEKAWKLFQAINHDNNNNMDKVIKNAKLFELQKSYGSNQFKIVDPKRDFHCEEPLNVIIKNQNLSVIGYFMSDMILFVYRSQGWFLSYDQNESHSHLQLSEISFIKPIRTANQSYMFAVSGDNQIIIFIAENEFNRNKLIELIQCCIDKLKQNSKQNNLALKKLNQENICITLDDVDVQVLGVDFILDEKQNYCIYVVQVTIFTPEQEFFHTINLEFQKIFDVIDSTKSLFPNINLPKVPLCKIKEAQSIMILSIRSIQIQGVLNSLLTKREFAFSKKNKKILNLLGIPHDFYSLLVNPEQPNKIHIDFSQSGYSRSNNKINEIERIQNRAEKIEKQDSESFQRGDSPKSMLRSNNFSRINQSSSQERINLRENSSSKRKISASKVLQQEYNSSEKFRIIIKLCGYQLDLLIPSQTKVSKLILTIANQVKLKEYFDFGLIDEKSDKILQDDEIIAKVEERNFLSKLMFKEETKVLLFRKILFLNRDIETELYFSDDVRLDLITNQAFEGIEQGHFKLQISELTLILAFWYFIQRLAHKEVNLREVLSTRYKNSHLSQDKDQIISEVYVKSDKISLEIEQQSIEQQTVQAKRIMLHLVSKHRLYGVKLFKAKYQNKNVEIGMKYDGLIINDCERTSKFPINHIDNMNSLAVNLTIELFEQENLELLSDHGFQIYRLWKQYKELNEDFNNEVDV